MTRVLIIEDEESYREATAFMLRKEGFEVNTAANGGLIGYNILTMAFYTADNAAAYIAALGG